MNSTQQDQIRNAVEALYSGGIIIYPTDTAFGIGCAVDNEEAIKRLFAIRRRPTHQAAPVLVDTVKMARDFTTEISQDVIDKLIEPYWPGALTIVLNAQVEKVPELVRGGSQTIGLRIPNHQVARAIIKEFGKPILGPSANFHGEKTPFSFSDLDPQLLKLVDYAVEGECSVKQASTVIDCSVEPWRIIRQGAVDIPDLL